MTIKDFVDKYGTEALIGMKVRMKRDGSIYIVTKKFKSGWFEAKGININRTTDFPEYFRGFEVIIEVQGLEL